MVRELADEEAFKEYGQDPQAVIGKISTEVRQHFIPYIKESLEFKKRDEEEDRADIKDIGKTWEQRVLGAVIGKMTTTEVRTELKSLLVSYINNELDPALFGAEIFKDKDGIYIGKAFTDYLTALVSSSRYILDPSIMEAAVLSKKNEILALFPRTIGDSLPSAPDVAQKVAPVIIGDLAQHIASNQFGAFMAQFSLMPEDTLNPVSYTHLTLPTKRIV